MKKTVVLFLIGSLFSMGSFAQFAQEAPRDRWSTEYSAGMMNAALGNLAKEKATSQLVKDFGGKEAIEHMNANEKLKASVKNPMPLTMDSKHKLRIDRINNKDLKNFDKDYLDTVIKNHQEEIDDCEKAMEEVKDIDLHNWLTTQVPMLKKHLEEAKELKDKL